MRHLTLLVVLGGVLAGAASASASTVVTSPGGALTGTAATSQIAGFGARVVQCPSTSYNATYAGGTGVSLPFAISTNLQLAFSGCRIVPGGIPVTIACTATATLNVASATTGAGVTSGTIRAISCTVNVTGGTCSVRVTGTVLMSHDNALAKVTIPTFTQTLVATGSTDGRGGTCSVLPNSTALTLDNGSSAALVFAESPAQTVIVA